jgi:hypothetical protein
VWRLTVLEGIGSSRLLWLLLLLLLLDDDSESD